MASFAKLLADRLTQRQKHAAATPHPDADLLTALAENRLAPKDRRPILAHLADCVDCREILSLVTNDAPVAIPAQASVSWRTLRWPLAIAASALLTFTVLHRQTPTNVISIPPQLAPQPQLEVAPTASLTVQPKPAPIHLRQKEPSFKIIPAPAVVPQSQAILSPPPPELEKQAVLSGTVAQTDSPGDRFLPQATAPPPAAPASAHSFGVRSLGLTKSKTASLSNKFWSLDSASPGTVRTSDDGGSHWSTVRVDSSTELLSLAVAGREVWIGSEHGTLFHSTDNGSHWNIIVVSDGATPLTQPITSVEIKPDGTVRIKTHSTRWITTDNGRTWLKISPR